MPESQIMFGDTIKTLDDQGKVGGYLVRFTDADHKDLDGEYFTAKTYLGSTEGNGVDAYFMHGRSLDVPDDLNDKVKSEIKGFSEHVFSSIKTTRDAVGIFAELVLDLSDRYEEAVHTLVTKGKLGWSSGAISHLVRKGKDGELKRWPIGEASLTPTPAEPRNRAIPVKSLDKIDFQMLADAIKGSEIDDEEAVAESFETFDKAVSAIEKQTAKMQRNHENRVKEGRMLSTSNRSKVKACRDSMSAVIADLDELLTMTEPKMKEEEKDVRALGRAAMNRAIEVLYT
jgi:hypothetical protein